MTPDATQIQAAALLETLKQAAGGDLKAAFAALCKTVTIEEIRGERYEAALARAVAQIFGPARPDYPPP